MSLELKQGIAREKDLNTENTNIKTKIDAMETNGSIENKSIVNSL